MVRLRRTLLAIVIGSALISRLAVAQRGSSSSLTHTVSVTVPPRVKVQVAALSPTSISATSGASATQGMSLNVSATRPWVLSIGANPSSQQNSNVRWSLAAGTGFSRLTSSQAIIASGTVALDPGAARVFFRNVIDTGSAGQPDQSGAPVMLTMVAP
ncbi:MAG: hypothetical protein M3037_08345 [Gemmatimonadota bacterium]|nr:hypothetical protein [Gemmatimonadota bacterium]